ncbi:Inorganic phosphate transporter 1-4 [Acorus gramineus]|uniref:Inorganic phosphate transporter 1-4 n=1 Tax=Acorus gramineus TaxID=55184 RepID=A0AAV9AAK3_ACOGR|nr:Inorganic phosphate transporter 1-4 [Acorus gramineus]
MGVLVMFLIFSSHLETGRPWLDNNSKCSPRSTLPRPKCTTSQLSSLPAWDFSPTPTTSFAFPYACTAMAYYSRMKMPETPRYTALVAKNARKSSTDLAKVLQVGIVAE